MPATERKRKPVAYVAGPLFNAAERAQAEGVDGICRRAGFATFLPHRDGGLVGLRGRTPASVFRADVAALRQADAIVAVLNGPAVDPGTAWEIGYGFARGVPVVGYLDDLRARPGSEPVDLMVSKSCHLVRSSAELRHVLRALRAVWTAPR